MGYEAQHRESDSSAMSGPSVVAGFQMHCRQTGQCGQRVAASACKLSEWLYRRCSRTTVDRPAQCKRPASGCFDRLCCANCLLEWLYRRPSRNTTTRPTSKIVWQTQICMPTPECLNIQHQNFILLIGVGCYCFRVSFMLFNAVVTTVGKDF